MVTNNESTTGDMGLAETHICTLGRANWLQKQTNVAIYAVRLIKNIVTDDVENSLSSFS